MLNLRQITLLCQEIERSTWFYVDLLGLPVIGFLAADRGVCLHAGEVRLILLEDSSLTRLAGEELDFQVEDLTGLWQRLAAEHVPHISAHGTQLILAEEIPPLTFRLRDPDGRVIILSANELEWEPPRGS